MEMEMKCRIRKTRLGKKGSEIPDLKERPSCSKTGLGMEMKSRRRPSVNGAPP
jgi:hypothetical protein